MLVERTRIPGVLILQPKKHGDERGFFSETYKTSALAAHGIEHGWHQDNHSLSQRRGTVRGLHFQSPPRAQSKLLRVTRGAILDVVVDIRVGSPTFGEHVTAELSSENWRQLYAPAGTAHGFCTLTDETEVLYKTSDEYSPEAEGGLLWNDPALEIHWPITSKDATVNVRDSVWPTLAELQSPFTWRD